MYLKIKILSISIISSSLLILFLCLGSQNIKNRYSINFLVGKTVELPNGFLIGSSFIIGFLSGGAAAALSTSSEIKE